MRTETVIIGGAPYLIGICNDCQWETLPSLKTVRMSCGVAEAEDEGVERRQRREHGDVPVTPLFPPNRALNG